MNSVDASARLSRTQLKPLRKHLNCILSSNNIMFCYFLLRSTRGDLNPADGQFYIGTIDFPSSFSMLFHIKCYIWVFICPIIHLKRFVESLHQILLIENVLAEAFFHIFTYWNCEFKNFICQRWRTTFRLTEAYLVEAVMYSANKFFGHC